MTRTESLNQLRRMIMSRRKGIDPGEPHPESSVVDTADVAGLEELLERLERHRHALEFDLGSPVPVLGRPLAALKHLMRRAFRSYLDRQSAYNEYSLTLSAALANGQRRQARELETRLDRLERRLDHLEKTLIELTESALQSEAEGRLASD